MRVVKSNEITPEDVSSAPIFFDGKVTRQSIVDSPLTEQFNFALVSFYKGARNHFHTHTSDQILFATDGLGIVATESAIAEIKEGDTAFIPAGEKHWHGAADGHNFAHISLTQPNSLTQVFPDKLEGTDTPGK
ncbi:MAG: cupin domain-containing protein [Chloroflexota bacterium]|nr:cupin domain-containing protein [Chloroflexota bacterium]|tara:strand:+ start:673 stop:1071 length:399 start_codon:yes stop_codon:yes gene_type:complete